METPKLRVMKQGMKSYKQTGSMKIGLYKILFFFMKDPLAKSNNLLFKLNIRKFSQAYFYKFRENVHAFII